MVGPSNFEFHSAADCLELYAFNRQAHGEGREELYWRRSWLPFLSADAYRLYVDCDRTDREETSPVGYVPWDWEAYLTDRAVSVANLVRTWTWMLEQDMYRRSVSERGVSIWKAVDWQAIPLFLRHTRLA